MLQGGYSERGVCPKVSEACRPRAGGETGRVLQEAEASLEAERQGQGQVCQGGQPTLVGREAREG